MDVFPIHNDRYLCIISDDNVSKYGDIFVCFFLLLSFLTFVFSIFSRSFRIKFTFNLPLKKKPLIENDANSNGITVFRKTNDWPHLLLLDALEKRWKMENKKSFFFFAHGFIIILAYFCYPSFTSPLFGVVQYFSISQLMSVRILNNDNLISCLFQFWITSVSVEIELNYQSTFPIFTWMGF